MKRPVVFLDIDGVLVTERSMKARQRLDPAAVAALERFLRESRALVVVSSTWRSMGLPKLREELCDRGLDAPIHGLTPDLSHHPAGSLLYQGVERGTEIQAWLADKGIGRRFVILDDDADMGALLPFLVKTNFAIGLTEENADAALRILAGEGAE